MTNIEFMREVIGEIVKECDPAAVAAAYTALISADGLRLVDCTWEEARTIMRNGGEAYGRAVSSGVDYAKCQIDSKGQQFYFDGNWYTDRHRWSRWVWKKATFDGKTTTRLGPYTREGKWGIPHLGREQASAASREEYSQERKAVEAVKLSMRSAARIAV